MAHVEGLVSVPALDGDEEASAPFTEYKSPSLAMPLLDIVVGTTVALVKLAQHTDFVLQLIVVDEAARPIEDLSLAFQAEWQSALSIHIGDTQQLPPIGLTVRQPDFKVVFSYQRQISLFHRLENAGRILARLRRNYRARVNAVSWAQTMFHGDNMSVVHRTHCEASTKFARWPFRGRQENLRPLS
ncbi:hypothetical protein FNYG_07038 [Fusarium nygamai]|uniref:DNA2/NAM7 helicase helicase domain-containing protein n=1 Tax=Gibberella nygamai TaxID=42673 RepID=A0A2K0WBN0_GIBNY|nr:hypothetical protein FNYG_07038 [Fusarium nygamai]